MRPCIVLLSNQKLTDNYRVELEKLQDNSWFRRSLKAVLAIGGDVNDSVLMEFTNTKELTFRIQDGENIEKILFEIISHYSEHYNYLIDDVVAMDIGSLFYTEIHNTIRDDNILWR